MLEVAANMHPDCQTSSTRIERVYRIVVRKEREYF